MSTERVCSFEGCSKKYVAKGLCKGHYHQQSKGKPLTPIRAQAALWDAEGDRWCTKCKRYRDPLDFYSNSSRNDGVSRTCKQCSKDYQRQYMFGLDVSRFRDLIKRQQGKCALCKTGQPGGNGTWHVDHDHSCCSGKKSCGKCVRSLLCRTCNVGLGNFKDSPQLLKAAIEYLESHGKVSESPTSV